MNRFRAKPQRQNLRHQVYQSKSVSDATLKQALDMRIKQTEDSMRDVFCPVFYEASSAVPEVTGINAYTLRGGN